MGTPRFTPESKEEAVKQVTERGYSVSDVSARLTCANAAEQLEATFANDSFRAGRRLPFARTQTSLCASFGNLVVDATELGRTTARP
jgi:hypothetical protein